MKRGLLIGFLVAAWLSAGGRQAADEVRFDCAPLAPKFTVPPIVQPTLRASVP